MRAADVEDGINPAPPRVRTPELREARKRIRLLEQENEVLRRAAAYPIQANLPGIGLYPLVKQLAANGIPRRGVVPGPQACLSALLPVAR
jgi:putative transposase